MAFYGLARIASRFGRFARRGIRALARRRPARAFVRRPRRLKKTQNKVHTFVRWCDKDTTYGLNGPSVVNETLTNQHLVYTFVLDNVVNPADFTNLYDMYRINKVTLYLERLRNATGDGTVNPYNLKMSVVHDYNDANPLTQEDEYLEYANCKRYSVVGNGAIKITLYPKINNIVENSGGAPSAFTSMNSNKVWLNIAEDAVPHFGLKMFIPAGVTSEGYGLFRVRAKYHLSMKNSK